MVITRRVPIGALIAADKDVMFEVAHEAIR
jgi:hypothetical protein